MNLAILGEPDSKIYAGERKDRSKSWNGLKIMCYNAINQENGKIY